MKILNVFNTGSRRTLMKSELEPADSSLDSNTDQAEVGVWVRDFREYYEHHEHKLVHAG